MGCYITLNNATAVEHICKSIGQHPKDTKILVMVGMDVVIGDPYGNVRDEVIVAALATSVIEFVTEHFLPHKSLQW